MLFNIFLNAIVLGITIYLITKGETKPDISILIGLLSGLSILSGLLSLFIGIFFLIVAFAIIVFAIKWAFDMTTKQSLLTTGIWIV
jgi:hypothetical protein